MSTEPPDGDRGNGDRGDKAICRHFARGYCRYGPECGFLHPGQNGPIKPLPPVYLTYGEYSEYGTLSLVMDKHFNIQTDQFLI